ncbi:hypothetical protein T439DRAFT_323319 [Meredithblackwellia eburnea MCA 4105]
MNAPGTTNLTPDSYVDAFKIPIPVPTLKHSFRLACDLEAVRSVGEGLYGDGSAMNWINFTGGHWEGTFGSGEVVAGGQDSQVIMSPDHPSAPFSALLSTRYLLKTNDPTPVFIQVQTRGWRTGPKEVMKRLSEAAKAGSTVEVPRPDEYKFRLFVEFTVDAKNEKYASLNQAMWVGSGLRSGRQVVYDAYLVE